MVGRPPRYPSELRVPDELAGHRIERDPVAGRVPRLESRFSTNWCSAVQRHGVDHAILVGQGRLNTTENAGGGHERRAWGNLGERIVHVQTDGAFQCSMPLTRSAARTKPCLPAENTSGVTTPPMSTSASTGVCWLS